MQKMLPNLTVLESFRGLLEARDGESHLMSPEKAGGVAPPAQAHGWSGLY